MWYLWISTEFYHRHILYKSMSIDLHSLDIGGQPRNRVHRSPIRILISKEKEKPTWFDSKASNEFLYFLDSPIDCFHSHQFSTSVFTRENSASMDYNGPFSFLTHSRSRRNRSPFIGKKKERRKFHIFLFLVLAGVHDISEPWMDSFTFSPTISQTWRIYPLFNRVENREHRSAFVRVLEIHDCWNSWRNLNQVST